MIRTVLYLDIEPTVLADLLRAFTMHGEMLAIRAGQDAVASWPAQNVLDETRIRTLLTARGLTPRQCDLVVLDLQGRSRTDIAERCGVSPSTVKKYWAAIYARLGVESRQMLRGWVLAELARSSRPNLHEQAVAGGMTP